MKSKTLRNFIIVSALYLAGVANPVFAAEDATLNAQAQSMNQLVASQGETRVANQISADFSAFAGSTANAESLVTGLRSGTSVTLTTTGASAQTASTSTFTVPTKPMGYGNVFISLGLAQQQLANLGITNPTSEQIQAALMGGTVTTGTGASAQTTTLPGILQMRADGMGWGKIANTLGVRLGSVVSGIKAANSQLASGASAQTGVNASSASGDRVGPSSDTRGRSGIVNAAGTPVTTHGSSGRTGTELRGGGHVEDGRGGASASAGAIVSGAGGGAGLRGGGQIENGGGHGKR